MTLRVPDYLVLIKAWRDAGVKNVFGKGKGRLSKKISTPPVMEKLIEQFVIEPKFAKGQVHQLVREHPMTAKVIYMHIIKPYVSQAEGLLKCFREFGIREEAGNTQRADQEPTI